MQAGAGHPGGGDPLAQPIFAVAPPRAGARLIGRALDALPGIWSISDGRPAMLSAMPELDPPDGRREGRLQATDCSDHVRLRVRDHLQKQLPKRRNEAPWRLLDASPRNGGFVPFLHAAFPDATFVYVHRRSVEALAEALALWRSGGAISYPELPGWTGPPWSFLLVSGWPELIGRPLAEVVTEQWTRTMRTLVSDLERLPPTSWCVVDHDSLLRDPVRELERLLRFLGIERGHAEIGAALLETPRFSLELREFEAARAELEPYLARTEELATQARDWIASAPKQIRRT